VVNCLGHSPPELNCFVSHLLLGWFDIAFDTERQIERQTEEMDKYVERHIDRDIFLLQGYEHGDGQIVASYVLHGPAPRPADASTSAVGGAFLRRALLLNSMG